MPAAVDHSAEKARSYDVRKALGLPDGRDGTAVARTRRAISNYAPDDPRYREIPAGTVCRVTTSNAGFRGIEAYAVAADGTTVSGVSLGAFDPLPTLNFEEEWRTARARLDVALAGLETGIGLADRNLSRNAVGDVNYNHVDATRRLAKKLEAALDEFVRLSGVEDRIVDAPDDEAETLLAALPEP